MSKASAISRIQFSESWVQPRPLGIKKDASNIWSQTNKTPNPPRSVTCGLLRPWHTLYPDCLCDWVTHSSFCTHWSPLTTNYIVNTSGSAAASGPLGLGFVPGYPQSLQTPKQKLPENFKKDLLWSSHVRTLCLINKTTMPLGFPEALNNNPVCDYRTGIMSPPGWA